MKICGKCKKAKKLDSFYPRRGKEIYSYCKECCSKNNRDYSQKNRKVLEQKKNLRIKEKRAFISKIKTEKGCSRCGYNKNPVAIDFHHTNEKYENVSRLIMKDCSIKKIMEEIKKCEILCAICHRIEHFSMDLLL